MQTNRKAWLLGLAVSLLSAQAAWAQCLPFDFYCLLQGYGQGQNDYSGYESPYGQPAPGARWANPYGSNPPRIVDQYGTYYGRYSTDP